MEFRELNYILDNMPAINIDGTDYKVIFDYGSHSDLLKFLKLRRKSKDNRYPIIWLETGFEMDYLGNPIFAEGKMKWVISTLSNVNDTNKKRSETSFRKVLDPTLDLFMNTINRSNSTSISKSEGYSITKYFNYDTDASHNVPEIWDAIEYNCTIKFNLKCLQYEK